MNLVIKRTLLLFFVSSFCILYAQDSCTDFTIQTNAESAGLFIDDKFIGMGNEFQIELEPGVHSIQIFEDLKKWNTEIITDTIKIEYSKEIFLTYNFNDRSLLNTSPQDVTVFEKDSLVGFTPLLLNEGFKELKLEKPDYKSLYITEEQISRGEIPELLFTGQPPKQQFYGSTLFTILIGTAIALGATTAYYKLEADDKFEEYKRTGNPELVDEVDNYDLISAATLIAFEVNIGLFIYFFLAE
ncbi:MAG: hypothetical protein OEM46_06140 [Ignavibacteria bacterium]|nr:hypothetical protein [Ignavibacteria bacterium]